MSPLTSTQTYVFAGEMQLGEELIDIALEFQGHSVRLRHADTVIGSWPRRETDFVRLSSDHYRVAAEGDSISFHPYNATEFGQFLAGQEPQQTAGPESEDPGFEPGFLDDPEPTGLFDNGPDPSPDHPDWATQVPLWNGLDDQPAEDEGLAGIADEDDLTSPGAVHGPNAARPVYPPTDPQPVRFSSPPPPTPVTNHSAHHPWQDPHRPDEPPETTDSPTPPPVVPSADQSLPAVSITERTTFPEPADTEPAPVAEPEPAETTPSEPAPPSTEPEPSPVSRPVLDDPDVEAAPGNVTPSPEPPGAADDPIPPNESKPPDPIQENSVTGAASALLDLIRGRITSVRSAVSQKVATPETETAPDTDDRVTPFDDAENLRQWAMVSVVGLAFVGLLVALTWGALSLFGGGDESPTTAPTTIPTTTSSVANAIDRTPATVAAPPVGSPDTTLAQDRPSFIEQWNRLATAYAYNLALDVDNEPVSTDVTSNIHLSFDQDRVLTLDMTPVGNGSDRDILVAMGMAVAWAEPDLSPSARKDLLSSLGIDIDSPKLADIGGELTRPGHTYRASVIDGIIRFQISPAP